MKVISKSCQNMKVEFEFFLMKPKLYDIGNVKHRKPIVNLSGKFQQWNWSYWKFRVKTARPNRGIGSFSKCQWEVKNKNEWNYLANKWHLLKGFSRQEGGDHVSLMKTGAS